LSFLVADLERLGGKLFGGGAGLGFFLFGQQSLLPG
jgi:hypothetical protein